MHRSIVAGLAGIALALTACTSLITGTGQGDGEGTVVVLKGPDLARELATSPVRRAPHDFVRVGLIWEASASDAIEIATSPDGATWSAFTPIPIQHVEVEQTAGFVGQVELGAEPARFYRLRGDQRAMSYARLELLPSTLSDSVEGGEADVTRLALAAMPLGDVEVNPRASWGARPSRCTQKIADPFRVTIHHTETPTADGLSPAARLRSIQRYHMDVNGWCDVGYHYLVSGDGQVWEGRPADRHGAHAGAGANAGNLGVALIGTFDRTALGRAALDATAALLAGLADRHGIALDGDAIQGHRDHKSTSCPGDALYRQLDELIATAAQGGGANEIGDGTGVTLRGILFEGADPTRRISGATITAGELSTITAGDGSWELPDAPPGPVTVTASAPGFASRSVERMAAGETWASFGLPRAGATSGRAVLQGVVFHTADSSNRVAFATVALSTGQRLTTDRNGFYKLTGLPAGPVTITASISGQAPRSVTRTLFDGETEWGSVRLDGDGDGGGGGPSEPPPGGTPSEVGDPADEWSCDGIAGDTTNRAGSYFVTSFGCWVDSAGRPRGDGDDNCIPWCQGNAAAEGRGAAWDALCGGLSGPACERELGWYAADADRFGCAAKLRVTNPDSGKTAVVAVVDRGPSCSIEETVDHWVLDLSYPASNFLFGEPKAATERGDVTVEVVADDTPIGPE